MPVTDITLVTTIRTGVCVRKSLALKTLVSAQIKPAELAFWRTLM